MPELPNGDSILAQPAWVVVRPQKNQYLFYNSRTDELHLVPPAGHAAYCRCDGVTTIDEIAESLFVDAPDACEHVQHFFHDLNKRGLVEVLDV